MIMKIWAWITNQEVVWLRDHDGDITITFARQTPYGLMAKRYWPFNIKNVICGDDGKVIGGGYVQEWRKQ